MHAAPSSPPHAVPSRFRTTLTAMHAKVIKMIMHLCCCWPIPSCAALFTAYGQLATCTCIRISACVHSHAHAIACMHDARMPISPMPYFGRYCRASCKTACFEHLGVLPMQFRITWRGACLHHLPCCVTVPMRGQSWCNLADTG